jgi:hypothetical protein
MVLPKQKSSIQGPYATLSHCWGKTQHIKLRNCNFDQFCKGLKVRDLPTSYREAITVCRYLGFRYLWIDSLCILQDSKQDWQQEASAMENIYGQGALNIATAAAAESTEASFGRRETTLISPLSVQVQGEDAKICRYHCFNDATFDRDVGHSPLIRRAWVVQERWLSPRTLFLTASQLWWECRGLRACEAFPDGYPNVRPDWGCAAGDYTDLAVVYDAWDHLSTSYSRCGLTVPSDKMVACSGIARSYQKLLPSDRYVAGFWLSQLPLALCWSIAEGRGHRPSSYRAPSWSWASIDGPIDTFASASKSYDAEETKTLCRLVDVVTYPGSSDPMGPLVGGCISLKARVTEIGSVIGARSIRMGVKQDDGMLTLIEGLGDNSDRLPGWTNRSLLQWDETKSDWQIAVISYFDGFPLDVPTGSSMASTTQTTIRPYDAPSWPGTTWAMQIVEYKIRGTRFCDGIILCQLPTWGAEVYQRVGGFHLAGELAIDTLTRRSSEQNLTII